MNTIDFVNTLLPTLERSRILSLIGDTRDALKSNLIPLYKNAAESFAGRPLVSTPAKVLGAFLGTDISPKWSSRPIEGVLSILEELPEKLDAMEDLVTKNMAKDVARSALTYRDVNVMQVINVYAFVAEYAGASLARIVAAELDEAQGKTAEAHLVPALKKYLDGNYPNYTKALVYASLPTHKVVAELNAIPQVTVIPDNHEVVQETVGSTKLDPLKFNFFGLGTNPAYFIGKWWADRQVASYKATVEEKKTTEFRLLALRQASQGITDPKVEQQIKYNQDRLEGLLREVRKMEERWAR